LSRSCEKLESVSNSSPSWQEFQLNALLDLQRVARVNGLQHHGAVTAAIRCWERATASFNV